ncbi:hypothetical protein S83_038226, partial [Arachis hypogaea]
MPQVINPMPDILHTYSFVYFTQHLKESTNSRIFHVIFNLFLRHYHDKYCLGDTKIKPLKNMMYTLCSCSRTGVVVHKYQEDFPNADEDLCPVDYVREFVMDEEFCRILDKAKGKGSLVVVDFYCTS